MTQHEYIEELSIYLRRTYDVTVSFEKKDNWSYGYGLRFAYRGAYSRGVAFNVEAEDWKDKLFKETNNYLKARGLIE